DKGWRVPSIDIRDRFDRELWIWPAAAHDLDRRSAGGDRTDPAGGRHAGDDVLGTIASDRWRNLWRRCLHVVPGRRCAAAGPHDDLVRYDHGCACGDWHVLIPCHRVRWNWVV